MSRKKLFIIIIVLFALLTMAEALPIEPIHEFVNGSSIQIGTCLLYIKGNITDLEMKENETTMRVLNQTEITTGLIEFKINSSLTFEISCFWRETKKEISVKLNATTINFECEKCITSVFVNENGLDININNILVFSSSKLEDLTLVLNESVAFLYLSDYDLTLLAKIERDGRVTAFPCPSVEYLHGGRILIENNKISHFSNEKLRVNFITKLDAPRILRFEVENSTCKMDLKEGLFGLKFIKEMKGEFESFYIEKERALKIVEGKIRINGIKIEDKNIYFTYVDGENLAALEKKGRVIVFDEPTKTLLISKNFNGTISFFGENITFKDGKPTRIVPNFNEIYEIERGEKEEYSGIIGYLENLKRAKKTNEATTCEEMGGTWKRKEEGCKIKEKIEGVEVHFPGGIIGERYNRYTYARIIDYQEGKVCCIKGEIKPFIIKTRKGKIFSLDSSPVTGTTVFTAPEGTVVIDVVKPFLEEEIKEVKNTIFEPSVQIPKKIAVTELFAKDPLIAGWYSHGGIFVSPKIVLSRHSIKESILTHEILHHLYYKNPKKIKQTIERYLKDKSLVGEEKITQQMLISYIERWWRRAYGPFFGALLPSEAHAVIGELLCEEWMEGSNSLGENVKFPEYVLEVYKGVLKPEVIEEGRK